MLAVLFVIPFLLPASMQFAFFTATTFHADVFVEPSTVHHDTKNFYMVHHQEIPPLDMWNRAFSAPMCITLSFMDKLKSTSLKTDLGRRGEDPLFAPSPTMACCNP